MNGVVNREWNKTMLQKKISQWNLSAALWNFEIRLCCAAFCAFRSRIFSFFKNFHYLCIFACLDSAIEDAEATPGLSAPLFGDTQ